MSKLIWGSLCVAVCGLVGLKQGQAGGRPELKPKDVPKAIKVLKESSSAKARSNAAEDLGELGAVHLPSVKDAVGPLIEAITEDKDAGVRKAAATAVGKIGSEADKAVPALMEALKDKSLEVKLAAITSLGRFGDQARAAVTPLREIAKDKTNKKLMQAAGLALKRIAGKQKN